MSCDEKLKVIQISNRHSGIKKYNFHIVKNIMESRNVGYSVRANLGTFSEPSRNLLGTQERSRNPGTFSEPSRNVLGTRGTFSEPSRNLLGTFSEPSRNLLGTRGTFSEPSRNPRNLLGTFSEPSRNPRNLLGTARVLLKSTLALTAKAAVPRRRRRCRCRNRRCLSH